jgi:hypothetical protein
VLQAGLLAVAVAAAVGGGVFEDGFSGRGVGDVGTTLAGDATAAAFTVEFSAAFPLFGAAVDGGLLRYFLAPSLGVGPVVLGGGARSAG